MLGIDRWSPPHHLGSSHGRARLIREAYYEDPRYVPLVRRAYELWRELEREVGGAPLLTRTGSVMVGHPDSDLVRGTLDSARRHGVDHAILDAGQLRHAFPAFTPPDDAVGVHEPGSSLLPPERIVALQLELAARAGAILSFGERVTGVRAVAGGIEIRSEREAYLARHVLVTAGAWIRELLPDLPVEVERQVQHWWEPARDHAHFAPGHMPVSMWQLPDDRIFYTMPDAGDGVKVGWHHGGAVVDPETVDREVAEGERDAIAGLLERFAPAARGRCIAAEACLYTNTPDRHFIVDRHPAVEHLMVVSACSGHGFKFASVLGEVVADLVTGRDVAFDLAPFGLARFQGTATLPSAGA